MKSVFLLLSFYLTISSASACRDVYSTCDFMRDVQKYDCNGDFMKQNCPKTCGKCGVKPHTYPPVTRNPTITNGPPPTGGCGKSSIQGSRVIAGQDTREGEFPWQILLLSNGRPGCGGSLISPEWVVTAAHCINGGSYSVVVGEHNRNTRTFHEDTIQASRAFTHPRWNRRTFQYDAALIKLSRPAHLNEFVNPVCLPDSDVPVGTDCYITGWGKTSSNGRMTHLLQKAHMNVIANDVCHRKNHAAIRVAIHGSMICGGGIGQISGCQGDSGGPFVCHRNGRWELHGAVSHGSRHCRSYETYTVFSRINYPEIRNWIRTNTGI